MAEGSQAPCQLMGLSSLQEFIRLGSLSKLSGKGLQQRMFFLVSGESCLSSPQSVTGAVEPARGMGLGLHHPREGIRAAG